jgi:coproporphyrinogen III oxidase-like Fe-S oxidoreductase
MHGKALTCHGNRASVANGRYIALGLGAHSYYAQARPLGYGIAMHGVLRGHPPD